MIQRVLTLDTVSLGSILTVVATLTFRANPFLVHYPHQVNSNTGATASKPPSQSQKPASQKSAVNSPPTPGQKPKQTLRPPANQHTTVKPSATTNASTQPPKNAPAPTPPGSAAVMAAVMAQAQAAAGQVIAAQQANKQQQQPQTQQPQQPQQPPAPAQPPAAQHPPPIPAPHPHQAYPYPYPYYLPPGQPGAPPYMYPGAPGAPAFIPAGTPGQGGAPPPGYPYMYPMYPAPIPVPQAAPAPVAKEKKTQRTYQACQKCRQWKAKCNGLKPCNHCQKRGVPCEYAERRNMTGANETNSGEQGGPQEESSQPPREDSKPGSSTADAVDPSNPNNTPQPNPPVAANPPPPPPPPPLSQPPAHASTQAAPPTASSPPHPTQVPQPPPPMAMYPPPPPGYAYPPQLYPGMPFPAPDPNAPYAHFVGMQYAQPYGPYMWAAPPPPPGHEPAPAAHVGEHEEGERDADGKLKIKRTFQACQKCRQRKAKVCNGVRPSCQNCASRGYACEYAKERSKPRGTNGEEGDETLDAPGTEAPTTMDPTQAMVSTSAPPVNHNQPAAPGPPPIPTAAHPNMFPPPPFPYDPNAYNPHVDPHQHGGQPMYAFPPYYGHPPGFGSIAGPPLVHITEEGSVPQYHTAVAPPAVLPGPPTSSSPTSGSSKRQRTVRPPGAPGAGKARIFQACERCRERKAKCDGLRPICTHCGTRDLNCEWADKRRMRGPAKGITPRRNRPEGSYPPQDGDVDMGMPAIPLGLNTAGLQQIEPHTSTSSSARKRKQRPSHSSGSPSPSESSSSSESSPSESDDDDADRNSSMGMGPGGISTGWA
ncbi:unnamed protein product [Rhizoctonia solani]|uniref:Zn(2)-C6 fungal-type domain-containing protein n=1 Tax=Rhizoctonia solani TaxID=456999 RepID=A0A8H3E0A1_9AGAM|nr:unnamed protein product [Rhizoctonia solani]